VAFCGLAYSLIAVFIEKALNRWFSDFAGWKQADVKLLATVQRCDHICCQK
jgi:hypothetical protein